MARPPPTFIQSLVDVQILNGKVTAMNANTICLRVVAGIVGVALLWNLGSQRADAHQPYGGCEEAWQAPRSAGAAHCRSHGWTVTEHLTLTPRKQVVWSNLRSCEHEDGSRSTFPCSWNFPPGGGVEGSLSYYLTGTYDKHRAHYVWPYGPAYRKGWRYVTAREAAAWPGRDWSNCRINPGPTTVVKCANGDRRVTGAPRGAS